MDAVTDSIDTRGRGGRERERGGGERERERGREYRIAGNFRGRKLSKTGCIMGVACLEFRGENFCRWLKNREIHESFLPRKFPAIQY